MMKATQNIVTCTHAVKSLAHTTHREEFGNGYKKCSRL